jgi:hypothetical protein
MDIRKVISEMQEERDRLGRAIEALGELVSEGKPRTDHRNWQISSKAHVCESHPYHSGTQDAEPRR